jgi:hypothetical protein
VSKLKYNSYLYKLLSKDNLFEEVRDEVVYIEFKKLKNDNATQSDLDFAKIFVDFTKGGEFNITTLRLSILASGLKEPITVFKGNEKSFDFFSVIDGTHRLRCLKNIISEKYSDIDIDEVEIPCIVTDDSISDDGWPGSSEVNKRHREFYNMEVDRFKLGISKYDYSI